MSEDRHPRHYSWPPFEPGNQVAKTHGLGAILGRHPELVPASQREAIADEMLTLLEEFPFLHQADGMELRNLATLQFEINTLAEYGDRVKAGEADVILRGAPKTAPRTGIEAWYATALPEQLGKLIEKASNVSTRLGLNPAGRFAIAKDLYTAKRMANQQGVSDLIGRGRSRLGAARSAS